MNAFHYAFDRAVVLPGRNWNQRWGEWKCLQWLFHHQNPGIEVPKSAVYHNTSALLRISFIAQRLHSWEPLYPPEAWIKRPPTMYKVRPWEVANIVIEAQLAKGPRRRGLRLPEVMFKFWLWGFSAIELAEGFDYEVSEVRRMIIDMSDGLGEHLGWHFWEKACLPSAVQWDDRLDFVQRLAHQARLERIPMRYNTWRYVSWGCRNAIRSGGFPEADTRTPPEYPLFGPP